MKNINEKGNSLIEVLAVFGILAVISIGVLSGIISIQSKLRISKTYSETKNIIAAMRQNFSAFRPTPEKLTEMLVTLGIFQDADGDGYSTNSLGHRMNIQLSSEYSSPFSTSEPTFRLTYYNVDPKSCIGLLSADWGNDPSTGLAEILVGNDPDHTKSFWWPKDIPETGADVPYPLPLNMEDGLRECTRYNSVNISWEYYF